MKKIEPELFEPYDQILFFLQKGEDLDTCGCAYALLTLVKNKFPNKMLGIVGMTMSNKILPGFNAFKVDDVDKVNGEANTLGVFCDIVSSRQIGGSRFVQLCKHICIFDHHEPKEKDTWKDIVFKRILWEHRDPSYSSCCELLWDIIDKDKFEITKEVAEYLCRGLFTDNRGLTSTTTNKRTIEIVGEMFDKGVDVPRVLNEYHSMDYKFIQLWCDVINNHSIKQGKVLFINLTPATAKKYIPYFFNYNPRTTGIAQSKCLTYVLGKAEELIDADVYVFAHYSLYKPNDKSRKLVYITLSKPNAICESILKQNGFTLNRNRWTYTKGMSLEEIHELIFCKFGNEFGVNSK